MKTKLSENYSKTMNSFAVFNEIKKRKQKIETTSMFVRSQKARTTAIRSLVSFQRSVY